MYVLIFTRELVLFLQLINKGLCNLCLKLDKLNFDLLNHLL